jgi:hypothetical protein
VSRPREPCECPGYLASDLASRPIADKAETHALGSVQAELFHARVALNHLRTDLILARADERTSPEDLDQAVTRAVQAVASIDNVITRIHRQLGARARPPASRVGDGIWHRP